MKIKLTDDLQNKIAVALKDSDTDIEEFVREAIEAVRPFGVDVCSGVRSERELSGTRLRGLVHAISC